jgi:phage-related protein
MKRIVDFYKTDMKDCPVQRFLDSLSGKTAQKITWVLSLIEELDVISEKFFKKLKPHEIWECRVNYENTKYRILCFMISPMGQEAKIILTNGFIKKTQKTPQQEIDRALHYKDDYINHGGDKR